MQALYRRYRPKTFDEVVGQETTITALKNQLREGRVHHAYIFSGTRGTGKTSVAKIFARAVNCLDPKDASPCNTCKICRGILEERIFDVVEMDAASNNSVDDIRQMREHVAYPPAVAKKKVYIIDEVHMLSKGAFNALLKMLEEPPAHALFILATTEPEKIPATIRSRSQCFTFLRLRDEEIAGELSRILDLEGREYTESALAVIASHSDGSMRDGLSILDQIMSLTDAVIDGDLVRESLGLTDHEGIFRIVDGILARDAVPMMEAVDQAYRNGKNFQLLIDELASYFRDLLFYRYAKKTPGRFTEGERETFEAHAAAMDESLAFRCIDLFEKGREQLKYAAHAKTAVEVLLLKTLYIQSEPQKVSLTRSEGTGNQKPAQASGQAAHAPRRAKPEKASREIDRPSKQDKTAEEESEVLETPAPEASHALSQSEDHAIIKDDEVNSEQLEAFIARVQQESVACGALLKDLAKASFENKVLELMYDPSFGFHIKMLKSEANKKVLDGAAREIFGDGVQVRVSEVKAAEDPVLESMKRVFKDTPIETDE